MYPHPIYLVGCPDDIDRAVTGPIGHVGGAVTDRFRSTDDAVARLWKARAAVVLLVATDDAGLATVRAVRAAAPGCHVLALTDPTRFVAVLKAGAAQAVMLPLEPGDCEAALGVIAEQFPAPPPAPATPPAPVTVVPEAPATITPLTPSPRLKPGTASRPILHPLPRVVPPPPPTPGAAPVRGRVVAVTGACGGAGATTVAVNLAVELADLGVTVALAEPTQPVGRLALFLDAHPAYTLTDLFDADGRVDPRLAVQCLHPVSDRLRLLATDHRPGRTTPPPADAAGQVAAALRGHADFAILDLLCTYDEPFFAALTGADIAVLVGDQRIPSVRTLQMLTEVLNQAGTEVRVVVNRYNPGLSGFTAANLQTMLQVPTVATVADDPKATAAAVNAGKPLKAVAPRSAARTDLARLARSLAAASLGEGSGVARAAGGRSQSGPPLLGRLARAFGLAGGDR